jgi:tetratricopeptide (TPR) repeat protein
MHLNLTVRTSIFLSSRITAPMSAAPSWARPHFYLGQRFRKSQVNWQAAHVAEPQGPNRVLLFARVNAPKISDEQGPPQEKASTKFPVLEVPTSTLGLFLSNSSMGKFPKSRKTKRNHAKPSIRLSDSGALLASATTLLQTGQPDAALRLTRQALAILHSRSDAPVASVLSAHDLLGQCHIELGDPSSALKAFTQAAALDPDGLLPEGEGGGPEKFFWLAQLCEDGGRESIQWFERGCGVLEREIRASETEAGSEAQARLDDKRRKLAGALCGMVEVWMTDLSYVLLPLVR